DGRRNELVTGVQTCALPIWAICGKLDRAMGLLEKLKNRARVYPQHIVLPEGEDRRAIAGAARVAREGYAKLTLLGRTKLIHTTEIGSASCRARREEDSEARQ